jgi:hypothetical protein
MGLTLPPGDPRNPKKKKKYHLRIPYNLKWQQYNPELNEWFDSNKIAHHRFGPGYDDNGELCFIWPFDTETEAMLFSLKWA